MDDDVDRIVSAALNDLHDRVASQGQVAIDVWFCEIKSQYPQWQGIFRSAVQNMRQGILMNSSATNQKSANVQNGQLASPQDSQSAIPSNAAISDVILLVYGIRDNGQWQQRAVDTLQRRANMVAKPVKFDWFDAVSFVSPFGLNPAPYDALLRAYSAVTSLYPKARVSVIAHSFGTYLVGELLALHPTIQLHRVILCGSVLPRDYRWDEVQDKLSRRSDGSLAVLNECGDRDYWPVVAKSLSGRYGDAGRNGFTHGVHVATVWFRGGHGCFFEGRHCEEVWAPFITGEDSALALRGNSSQPKMTLYERVRATISCVWLFGYVLALLLVVFRKVAIPCALIVMTGLLWMAYRWFTTAPARLFKFFD